MLGKLRIMTSLFDFWNGMGDSPCLQGLKKIFRQRPQSTISPGIPGLAHL